MTAHSASRELGTPEAAMASQPRALQARLKVSSGVQLAQPRVFDQWNPLILPS